MKICELCGAVEDQENIDTDIEQVKGLHLCDSCLGDRAISQLLDE